MTTLRAWHFVGDKLRDGRPIPPIGFKLVHPGPVIPCLEGLHASEHPFDALHYAPGNTLCLVELSGKIVHHENDKVVASERTIIKKVDAEYLMRRFAKDQALSVIHLWNAPNVVKRYLEGDDESLRNASYASFSAASFASFASSYASYASSYASSASSSASSYASSAASYASFASSYASYASSASSASSSSSYASFARQKFVEKQRTEFEKRVMDLFCL